MESYRLSSGVEETIIMDKIKTIAQFITAFASAGVVLYGVFTLISLVKENNVSVQEIKVEMGEVKADVKELKDTVIFFNQRTETKQDKTIEAVQRNTGEFAALRTVVTTGFKKIMTADEVFEMFNTLEKGKSNAIHESNILIRKTDGKNP